MPARWFDTVQESGVQIPWCFYADSVEHFSNIAPMVATMRDDMKQHLLTGHGSFIAVCKCELNHLLQMQGAG